MPRTGRQFVLSAALPIVAVLAVQQLLVLTTSLDFSETLPFLYGLVTAALAAALLRWRRGDRGAELADEDGVGEPGAHPQVTADEDIPAVDDRSAR